MKILIVDDHGDTIEGLKKMLLDNLKEIEEVVHCFNINDAQSYIDHSNIDLMLLDLQFNAGGDLDEGNSFLEKIRGNGSILKIIAYTSNDNLYELIEQFHLSGGNGYISKSSALEDRIRVINDVIGNRSLFPMCPRSFETYMKGQKTVKIRGQIEQDRLEELERFEKIFTDKHKRIMWLLHQGKMQVEIAKQENITLSAVKDRIKSIQNKYEKEFCEELRIRAIVFRASELNFFDTFRK